MREIGRSTFVYAIEELLNEEGGAADTIGIVGLADFIVNRQMGIATIAVFDPDKAHDLCRKLNIKFEIHRGNACDDDTSPTGDDEYYIDVIDIPAHDLVRILAVANYLGGRCIL